METNFELKNVTLTSKQNDNVLENQYDLKFKSNNELKTIRLTGTGKLKEAIKI